VWGSPFADTLLGTNANEIFRGNAGADIIQAGGTSSNPDVDEADYSNSPSGITVNIQVISQGNGFGSASDGWGFTDILRQIENIRGSDFADVINTDAVDNTIWGNGGNDKINAGLGNDVCPDVSGAYSNRAPTGELLSSYLLERGGISILQPDALAAIAEAGD